MAENLSKLALGSLDGDDTSIGNNLSVLSNCWAMTDASATKYDLPSAKPFRTSLQSLSSFQYPVPKHCAPRVNHFWRYWYSSLSPTLVIASSGGSNVSRKRPRQKEKLWPSTASLVVWHAARKLQRSLSLR